METLLKEKEEQWLTTKEAAIKTGVSGRTLLRWTEKGKIPRSVVKSVVENSRPKNYYKADYIDKLVEPEKKPDQDMSQDDAHMTSLCLKYSKGVLEEVKDLQHNNTRAFLEIYEKYAKIQAKNSSKRTVIIFLTVILLVATGVSTWLMWNLFNKNETLKLEHQTKMKEIKSIFYKNDVEMDRLKRENQTKDNKIFNLEQQVKQFTDKEKNWFSYDNLYKEIDKQFKVG